MIEPHKDDRIDALATQVAVLAVRMDEGFKRMDERFEQVDKRFEGVDERLEKLDDRFQRMQWILITIAGGIIAALIAAPHL